MLDLFDYSKIPEKIRVRVTPNAKKELVKKEIASDGTYIYKVYVNAPPEEGKANKAVINLIAKNLQIAKSDIKIISGLTSREKIIKIC